MAISYAQKAFVQILESVPQVEYLENSIDRAEGIVTSTNDFFKLLSQANDIFNKTFNISDRDKLIFAEDIPLELAQKLNNQTATTIVTDSTLRDIRIVTYNVSEQVGSPGAHKPGDPNIKNIKYRLAEVYPDPEYTGYSILRYKKEIEANITFQVWGIHYQDIRDRAILLRKIINNSAWYFTKKGLKEIVWTNSFEQEKYDHTTIAKSRSEKYIITFNEIREIREKNLEQIILEFGINT